jgi:nucleoside-diphosphate-sugar epimerase
MVKQTKVLVIGAGGFIGRHLVKDLVEHGVPATPKLVPALA